MTPLEKEKKLLEHFNEKQLQWILALPVKDLIEFGEGWKKQFNTDSKKYFDEFYLDIEMGKAFPDGWN